MRFVLPSPAASAAQKAVRLALVAALHAAALAALAAAALRPPPADSALRLDVRVIEEPPRAAEPDRPRPQPVPAPTGAAVTPPVLAAAPAAPAVATFSVPPPPATDPAPSVRPPPPLVSARFDAAYLHNPPPEYPFASRRLREQGQVLLRVRVDAQGRAKEVQVQESSGHPRLDEAAVDTVRLWQFVPARRGDEPVEDTALVPVVFRLDR